ncbi:GH92 family glycosyl hydrolase [Terriglobus tenax]|uniref:GH92 family glycosyl hydrolase n=1 Tax=Terriglobus tenax TaxID=1111115 RepID=UPI0021E06F11|nr:GH92 family glycosyl hydrolase [Terriglobus tenax]
MKSLLAVLVLSSAALAQSAAYKSVDPMIGTGPDGHTFPGAVVPFGMVQLSPDTEIKPFKQSYKWAAGYRYEDTSILGFSHTHFSGAGHSDLGDLLLTPESGEVKLEPEQYRSAFRHETEHAEPGYYTVLLDGPQVKAELTATTRVGVHRYSFPQGKPAHLVLDLRSSIYNYPGKVMWSRIRLRPDGTLTGMRETRGWAPARQLYFAIRFSQPLTGHFFRNVEPVDQPYNGFSGVRRDSTDVPFKEGRGITAAFDFGQLAKPLVVEVALSTVSEEGAIANLNAEAKDFDFDRVRAQARAAWEKELARVEFTGTDAMRKNLYTALYHALMAPSTAMDVDGRYRGPDEEVHQAKDWEFVSTFSLWDTYRAEQPLMTLLQPEARTNNVVRSLVASQQQSPFGILPVWQFAGLETWCMIGYHAVPILADAYLKNIRGYDAEAALNAMVASARYRQYEGVGEYIDRGYVPVDRDDESASETMEYAFDDWTIAQMAHALHKADIEQEFTRRAAYWRNVFDQKTGFVRPKLADGTFREPFDPAKAGNGSGFTEGNAWQYSWYQPQDEAGLINLLGGDDKLIAKLDAMFDARVDPRQYADVEDIAGMIGQYIHGNEPSHHLAYLYAYAGAPWRTQERLKQIVDSQYRPAPDGLVGNDDLGQMSAWLLFTGIGFYPVAPGSNEYVLGRPFVDSATLHLPNGKTLHIVKQGSGDYVGNVALNGKALDRVFVTHEQLLAGGELRFTMQTTPNKNFGRAASARPYSMSTAGK